MTTLELPKMGIMTVNGKSEYQRLPYEFTFTDRESYLEWRKSWREMYAELSQKIRLAKNNRNQAFRDNKSAYNFQCECGCLKGEASDWLEIRKLSKLKAKEQRNAVLR